MTLSLEPLRVVANDGHDADLFAKPARLLDVVLEDGSEVFSREDPKKGLSERLMRIWAERGDFSLLTADSIRNPKDDAEEDKDDEDSRPSEEDMRKLQETMLTNLATARGELTTALDLLSVLSAPTDPPDVDPNALPLPQQTLTLVPTAVPPPPSTDPSQNPLAALPLATSLDSLKLSANAFFRASEELIPLDEAEQAAAQGASGASSPKPRPRTRAPDPWPTILQLHASSSRTLLPLGALPGATLTGKGENRTARQVGVFFGCQEAKVDFRRAAVASVGELLQEGAAGRTGRKLVVEVETRAKVERAVWDEDAEGEGVDKVLSARGRAAFAEELFAQLTNEARLDASLRAQIKLGTRAQGDAVEMEGSGWVLRVKMMASPSPATATPSIPSTLLPLIRLVCLQEYASRRSPSPSPARPLLSLLSTCLNYMHRLDALRAVLERLRQRGADGGAAVELELFGATGEPERGGAGDVLQVLQGARELGGRAVLRVGTSHVFHVVHSYPLPPSPGLPALAPSSSQPTLTLRLPRKAPIPIPSLHHLETFLGEQLDLAVKAERASASAASKGEDMGA
ncbi:hypothetical protein JCM10207_004570 [Rhodosporidiobolus poonsookiae]